MALASASPPLITLTTDFGAGPFVGLMKGVILGICPWARLVDLSHAVPPQSVRSGALVLEQAIGVFPPGAIHLAVVDPGVGTERLPICIKGADALWVGPDNGIFTPVLEADAGATAYELADESIFRKPVSATFHGRDIFAPMAAHLALGRDPARLGPVVKKPVRLDWPKPYVEGECLVGQVLEADRFGNLITNLTLGQVEEFLNGRSARITIGSIIIEGLSQTYGQAPPGKPVALFNSLDRLELALAMGDFYHYLEQTLDQICRLKVSVGKIY